jgi:hypothetical protein
MGTVNECGMILGNDLGLKMIVEHSAVFLVPRAVGKAREEPRETHPVVDQLQAVRAIEMDLHFGLHRSDGPRRVNCALFFKEIESSLCRVDHQEWIVEDVDIYHVPWTETWD